MSDDEKPRVTWVSWEGKRWAIVRADDLEDVVTAPTAKLLGLDELEVLQAIVTNPQETRLTYDRIYQDSDQDLLDWLRELDAIKDAVTSVRSLHDDVEFTPERDKTCGYVIYPYTETNYCVLDYHKGGLHKDAKGREFDHTRYVGTLDKKDGP